jgi:acyl-CoA thioesterase II
MADLPDLIASLDLEAIEDNLFRGAPPTTGWARVFGGHIVGQALAAAHRTVSGRPAHSLHANFLVGGDPAVPIVYSVERVRDGSSFSNRRVTAIQHGRTMFTMSASFHKPESGLDHQMPPPPVAAPADLPERGMFERRWLDQMPEAVRLYFERERPIELRPASTERYMRVQEGHLQHEIWMRARGEMPDDLALHQCVLAYASDFTLLDTALVPHGYTVFSRDIVGASLDHSVWFHRPFRFAG